jgi:pseudouridine synthase
MSPAGRRAGEQREQREPQRERVQKLLARAGAAPSRRQAEELIREGRVTINGTVAELGAQVDPRRDAVKVDGKRIHPRSDHYHYLLLNKPSGVMSTRYDPEGRPTVLELVPPGLRKALVPVGRLDFQTEGLLLLTDDGDLAHRVGHPRYGCTKRYHVKVKGTPDDRELDKLRGGIVLDGRRTAPCEIQQRRVSSRGREATAGNSWWTVTLTEGRTRQIREMFQRVGHPVQRLRRVAIGPITGAGLPSGDVRELTEAEVDQLRNSSSQESGRASAPPRRRSSASSQRTPAGAKKAGVGRKPGTGKDRPAGVKPAGPKPTKRAGSQGTRSKSTGSRTTGSRSTGPKSPGSQRAGAKSYGPKAAGKSSGDARGRGPTSRKTPTRGSGSRPGSAGRGKPGKGR